jgi:alginate O-acetyltransferase complex protein AlgI
MAFSSLEFLYGFLPVVLFCYAFFPASTRNGLILVASIAFYAWTENLYTAVLLVYIVANWAFGLAIERTQSGSPSRRRLTACAVLANLAGLVLFKYAGFLASNIAHLAPATGMHESGAWQMHLPIGISFFAFQGISYVVDVGRMQIKAAPNLITFGAYKAFFPQLIAGPIVRYKDVAADFARQQMPAIDEIAAGIRRFAVGLAKKVLIANSLAVPADAVFGAPAGTVSSTMVWYGVLCYALQLYFDFSGYSDMAIGLGRIFGIHIRENFAYPYISSSVREFWQRWHISLSSWFRDYLYIPLGGSRAGRVRTTINLCIVFLLCGLWHGAQWTFVAWGAWHGAFLAVEHWTHRSGALSPRRHPALSLAGHVYTALVVLIGWVLFRSASLSQAADLLGVMFTARGAAGAAPLWLDLANGQTVAALAAALIGSTPWMHRVCGRWNVGIQNVATIAAFVAATIVLASSAFNPFIYFRF